MLLTKPRHNPLLSCHQGLTFSVGSMDEEWSFVEVNRRAVLHVLSPVRAQPLLEPAAGLSRQQAPHY